MDTVMMNTRKVAQYLGIHEKQVYALIKEKKIPCTRVTGKWIFPKDMIDEWIHSTSVNNLEGMAPARGRENILLASGSNDPILDILLNDMKSGAPDLHIFSSSTGSTAGLRLLAEGKTHIAWCHLIDPETGEYNVPYVASHFDNSKIAIVHLFRRQTGFVQKKEYTHEVHSFKDLADRQVRFINRQPGSGIRVLLDHHLRKESIDPSAIPGYGNEVYTHFEVGLEILSGKADAGIATVAVANLMGLKFFPIVDESFDMVLHQETFFSRSVQCFIETLNSERFREKVKPLGYYDFSESGKILHSTAHGT